MTIRQRPEKLVPQRRSFVLRADDLELDAKNRTILISFSSEEPVDMWYGTEILSHADGAMRTDGERQQSMPLLYNHDQDLLLGIIEELSIEDARGYALVRFGQDEGQYGGVWAMSQVADGILINSSFLYRVYSYEEDLEEDTLTATDWEPFEISLVTIPADPTVGVGRAEQAGTNPVTFKHKAPKTGAHRSITHMPNETAPGTEKPGTGAAPSGGGAASTRAPDPVELESLRQEAVTAERRRFSDIQSLASRFHLDATWVERHRAAGSTVDQARASALDEVERLQSDQAGIQERERTRCAEIDALAARHQLPADMVQKHKKENTSIELFRGLVLDFTYSRGNPKALSSPSGVDWTVKEAQSYSLRKAILAAVDDDWRNAGFEREVSNSIQKSRPSLKPSGARSFFMPTNVPFQVRGAPLSRHLGALPGLTAAQSRSIYQVGTAADGGDLVGTELLAADFIEVLRNATVTGQLGARFLTGLVENINIPRQDTQTQTYWVGESVALTESEATFDQVQLRPHAVGALSKMSRLMLQQSTPAIEQIVREDLLMVSALAIDAAALYGTGSSGQPTGIASTTGIGSVVGGTNGANMSFQFMIALYAAPLVANAPQANLAFAINAKVKAYLATLVSTTGQFLWSPLQSISVGIPDQVVGYRYGVSNQLPYTLTKGTSAGNCSMSLFGNWQELLIGEWGVTEIMANPYDSTGFTTGDVSVRAFSTVDVGLRHPASFAAMSDGLTPGF